MIGPVAKREGVTDLQTAELIKKSRSIMGKMPAGQEDTIHQYLLEQKTRDLEAFRAECKGPMVLSAA